MDVKARRTALGLSRKELARLANVDPSMLQLIELGMSNDDESKAKVNAYLDSVEKNGHSPADPNTNGSGTTDA
jgi:transcriptional regulator with XRE-family HTH domain